MESSDIGWNDIGTSGSRKKDTIDSVIDAFNSVIGDNSDAILGSGWKMSNKKVGSKTKDSGVVSKPGWGETFSATSNQDESENSWSSWGNGNGSNSRDNSNNSSGWGNGGDGWGNDDNQNYPTNNNNSAYTNDRRSYQDINKVTNTGTNSYTDNSEKYHESTHASELNQVNNVDMHTNNINNFSKTQQEFENQTHGWSQPPQQQQQQQQQHHQSYYEHQESPSPSESDASTDHNSENLDPDNIKMKLSAWHSLVDSDFKEREDGIGGGQLHRRGKNYNPVDEATVLAIQQKGGGFRRGGKRVSEKPIPKIRSSISKPPIKTPQKPITLSKPINNIKPSAAPTKTAVTKTVALQNQKQNTQPTPPNRTQQQTQQALKKPSPPPSQSSQFQPSRDVSQPSRDSSRSQQPQQHQQPQQPQQSQQPQQFQKPQQSQQPQQLHQPQQSQKQQQSWNSQLVNEPFWETTSSPPPSPPPIQHPSPKKYANEAISNQSQPIRYQSPARSPRPAKPVQEYYPYIPPEFDSTPYRKQPSPSPVRDKLHRHNEPVTKHWEDNKDYENNVEGQRNEYQRDEYQRNEYQRDEYQRNEYYEESDVERRDNKFSRKESEREQALRVNRRDRGQLLLTINVELSEGKTQAIEVHVNDDPMDLAKDFCDLWKVTNPVVMPALECLIKEEKEKRLGIN